jgi:F-box/leucine-rich repeat protein 14
LRTLSLARCNKITDAAMPHLAALTHLVKLDLSHCDQLTDSAVSQLAALALEGLELEGCDKITDAGIQALCMGRRMGFSLRKLNLALLPALSDVSMQHAAAKLKALTHLQVARNGFTDDGLRHMAALPQLCSLHVARCVKITGAGLQHLSKLQSIDLARCEAIDDASIAKLGQLSNLRELRLMGCEKVTDAGVAHLALCGLTALQVLDMSHCGLTDACAPHIRKLTALNNLKLRLCFKVSDAGVAQICRRAASLRALDVSATAISDSGMASIATCTGLEALRVAFCGSITDAGLALVGRHLLALRYLSAEHCAQLSDAGVASLRTLVGLEGLNLSCDRITDVGLAIIATMPALRNVDVTDCTKITRAAKKAFRRALPGCELTP